MRYRYLAFPAFGAALIQSPVAYAQVVSGETIEVNGNAHRAAAKGLLGETHAAKSVSILTQEFIKTQAPTPNPYHLLASLPGANVANSDPYGMAAGNMTIRGMNSDQIGFMLDGAPINDVGNYAAYPTEWVDPENLSEISLAQGSANLDTPVIGASGGLVSMSLRDPSHTAGALANVSYGSYLTDREFLRGETGDIGQTGMRAFLSWSHIHEPHFRGPGADQKQHIDFKLAKDWQNGSRSTLSISYDDSDKVGYKPATLAQWQQYGRKVNYTGTFTPNDTAYYKLHQLIYRQLIVSAPQTIRVTPQLSFDLKPYLLYNTGVVGGASVVNETGVYWGTQRVSADLNGNGTIGGKSLTYTPYGTLSEIRAGLTSEAHYRIGRHQLVMGDWFDWSNEQQLNPYAAIGTNGLPSNAFSFSQIIRSADGRSLASYDNTTITRVNGLFVGDSVSLLGDRLKLDAAFKEIMVSRIGYNHLPGSVPRIGQNSSVALPTLAAHYQFSAHHQIFADVATSFRVPTLNALYNTYSASTGAITTAANLGQKTEYAISEELGYRYYGPILSGTVTFFNYNFTNRQVSTMVNINNALISQNINVGGQTSRGIDAELGTRSFYGFRPYVSAEYLHTTIDNNYRVGNDYLPTAGKQAVRSPEFIGSVNLAYDSGPYSATVAVKYTGRQFATFMNDQAMPGYATADIMLGYKLPHWGKVKPLARLNLLNITDSKYLSGVSGVTAASKTTRGVYGTSISGSAPTYYIGGGFAAMLTLSAEL